jgi:hypothetical protein
MNTSKAVACLMLFQYLLFSTGLANVTKLPDEARAALHGGDFTVVKKVNQIPSGALQAIKDVGATNDFTMADFGKPFQKTDVVTDKNLPLRQLQFAAISKDYVLIHYAVGGYSLGYFFILLKKSGDKFVVTWTASGPQCSDLHQFLTKLKSDKIDDSSDYGP